MPRARPRRQRHRQRRQCWVNSPRKTAVCRNAFRRQFLRRHVQPLDLQVLTPKLSTTSASKLANPRVEHVVEGIAAEKHFGRQPFSWDCSPNTGVAVGVVVAAVAPAASFDTEVDESPKWWSARVLFCLYGQKNDSPRWQSPMMAPKQHREKLPSILFCFYGQKSDDPRWQSPKMAPNSPRKNCRAFCFVFVVRKMMIQDGNLQRWPQNVCMCMCMRINLSGQMRATRVLPQPSGTTAQDAHVVSAAQGHRN